MRTSKKTLAVAGLLITAAIAAAVALADSTTDVTGVPSANTRSDGYAPANILSPELQQIVWAQGSTKLENPSGIAHYGYENDTLGPTALPQMLPTAANPAEAQKTEPDKNTYVVFKRGLHGADPHYDYGTHFLFQGHEARRRRLGYITRINLDADADHRVTLLATRTPPARRSRRSTARPGTRSRAAAVHHGERRRADLCGHAGLPVHRRGRLRRARPRRLRGNPGRLRRQPLDRRGHRRGEQAGTTAKRPNSFVYRYVPRHPATCTTGKLQVLQVLNGPGTDHVFEQAALNAPDQVPLTTTATARHPLGDRPRHRGRRTAAFNANTARRPPTATPFKRPENGLFRPGSHFQRVLLRRDRRHERHQPRERHVPAAGRLDRPARRTSPSARQGQADALLRGDEAHAGFDNVAFLSRDMITFVEDAGDGLHRSATRWTPASCSTSRATTPAANEPVRWLAEGRTRRRRSTPPTRLRQERRGQRDHRDARLRRRPGRGGILGAKSRLCSAAAGAGSTPSSTATTRPTRSSVLRISRTARERRRQESPPLQAQRGGRIRAGLCVTGW